MSQSESHQNRSVRSDTIGIDFDHSYATQLFGFYQNQHPDEAPAPQLIAFNHRLAAFQFLPIKAHSVICVGWQIMSLPATTHKENAAVTHR